jgi:putative endonuclease
LRSYYVYILASKRNGTLYIGVTNNLIRRVGEHRRGEESGFTKKYHVTQLVWFDVTDDVSAAIWREKCMKWWKRRWKVELIEKTNPEWRDLWEEINQ